jgi:hypothetical protein
MSKQPKLTVTVGENTCHWRHGTTVIQFENTPITVTWRLGITNYERVYDEEGFEDTTYSDRFVANPPKKTLGKFYDNIRNAAVMACEVQRRAESEARNGTDPSSQRKIAELDAQGSAEGLTIILNQAEIDKEAQRKHSSIEDVPPSGDDGLSMEGILGGGKPA